MQREIVTAVHRRALRPSEKQAAVLQKHAAYAETARRWAREQEVQVSVKKLYSAFKESGYFDEALSGTVAERAIAGVVDGIAPPSGGLFNAADEQRHGSKHVRIEDVAARRRRGEVVKEACQRIRLPRAGRVEVAGEWLSMEGRVIREAWIGRDAAADWRVEIRVSARVLVRTCKVRLRTTRAQRAALAALARRVDAVWNAIGTVVWAAGARARGPDARQARAVALEARLQGAPDVVCASARAVCGEERDRPYADTKMVKGWSRSDELAVAGEGHRLTQAVICEVVAQYRTSQDLTLDRAKDRQRKRAVQRRRDGELAAGRRLAAAYAKTGEVDPDLLQALADAKDARPVPHTPKPADLVLQERDGSPEVRCPAPGCDAVFPRTRSRCPQCGHGRQPKTIGEEAAWSTTRRLGWIPLRGPDQGGYALEWEDGVYRARLHALGGMSIRVDEPERLAGLVHRTATLVEDARGLWSIAVAYEEPVWRPGAYSAPIGVNLGLRELVTTSRGESFIVPRYRARDAGQYRRLQGARDGKARKAGRASGGRNQARLRRLAMRQAASRLQRHREIARALLCMPARRHTEPPLGRAPEGEGRAFEPPSTIYVGSWRPATQGREDRWQHVDGRDQAVASFVQVLSEQAERVGSRVVHEEESFTTMTCSACGTVRETQVPAGMREWTCARCGARHVNKYVNAAKNILARGLDAR